jgi:hypothetical protein
MPLATFSENKQAQIKREHLAELEPLLTKQGLWVDVAANFSPGTKNTLGHSNSSISTHLKALPYLWHLNSGVKIPVFSA